MGASAWSYFVPYEADLSAAFSRLRADVFARREFYSYGGASFTTIEELLEAQEEDGTHSIIDMARVVDQPAPPPPDRATDEQALLAALAGGGTSYGIVFRMSDDELLKCFSTTTPTRSAVAQAEDSAYSLCPRGTGRYTVVYDDDKTDTPTWLYFVGVSGD